MRFPATHPIALLFCWLFTGIALPAKSQVRCADPLSLTPATPPGQVNWKKFPEFTLPFTLIYGAPRLGDTLASPLRHGFSHLATVLPSEFGTLVTPRERALDWSGFAFGLNQPWETLLSPWDNDTLAYQAKWDWFITQTSGGYTNAKGKFIFPISFLAVDIERFLPTDDRIVRLKQEPKIPAAYRNLPDADFISAYKRDMTALYGMGLRYIRQKVDLTGIPLMTYSDVPIRNTFFNVTGNTWTDWRTNPERVSFLVKDQTTNRVGGPFYQQLDALGPSAYYYYDYPSPLAPDYLAYMLFQIEANQAWSDKPIIPYVWMRYHDCCGSFPKFLQPFMAEATAIFPFFSGAKGLWFWDHGVDPTASFAAYEHFVHGLYRLSRFADVFTGDYKLVIPKSARDHMDDRTPIWRGAVKDNRILIAAHNPYATETQTTRVPVSYGSWQTTLTLKGREVYLCQFDLTVVTGNNEEIALTNLKVFPNPAVDQVTVRFDRLPTRPVQISFVDLLGRTVLRRVVDAGTAYVNESVPVSPLKSGLYTVIITDSRSTYTQKVVINR
ncbi:hypothetical protein GCM10023187_44160 [Nibrella viscosa]|uniref:Secretion system C-terminal sorting domain-containing protein n=1 Tax=Nibrella viscosa TaxID=1084524 RepID=A0ABP8KRN7_9BACT